MTKLSWNTIRELAGHERMS